ncbi:MAG: ASPIC/UnbV domain-containing protein [Pirellulaceae bacterium]
MSQPLDMECQIKPQGEIDEGSGEFWVENPFDMLSGKHNFSAYESNKLLMNVPGRPFADLSHESGADIDSDSRSAIAADFDRDGDLDLLVGSVGGGALRLFQNRIPHTNQRMRLILKGTESNPEAIGARVTAEIGDQLIVRDVFPVSGFSGQAPSEVILGIGDAKTIDRLNVRWPTGKLQTFKNIKVAKLLTLTEGSEDFQLDNKQWMPRVLDADATSVHAKAELFP